MADTMKVTFTRPVRVDKKRYVKGAVDTIAADVAEQLMALVPPAAVEVQKPEGDGKKS